MVLAAGQLRLADVGALPQRELFIQPAPMSSFYYEATVRHSYPRAPEILRERIWYSEPGLIRREQDEMHGVLGELTSVFVGNQEGSQSYDPTSHSYSSNSVPFDPQPYPGRRASTVRSISPYTPLGLIGSPIGEAHLGPWPKDRAEVIGHALMLGRRTTVIRIADAPPWRLTFESGPEPALWLKLWVDIERGFILRSEFHYQGETRSIAQVTRADYDADFLASTFAFEPPQDALARQQDVPNCDRTPLRGEPLECKGETPAGFLFPSYLPAGYIIVDHDFRKQAKNAELYHTEFEPSGSPMARQHGPIIIDQWRRPGGFPGVAPRNDLEDRVSKERAYTEPRLRWHEGDLVIEIYGKISAAELNKVAESMR